MTVGNFEKQAVFKFVIVSCTCQWLSYNNVKLLLLVMLSSAGSAQK